MKSNVIAAIDPGKTGGVCIMAPQRTEVHKLDGFNLKLLRACTHVFVEKAQAMPKQGVSSMFSYGVGFGRLIGWLESMDVPYTLVTPQAWMKTMHVGTDAKLDAKKRSLQAAQRMFPRVSLLASERSKKPHEGLIDALLICEHGRRVLAGGGK